MQKIVQFFNNFKTKYIREIANIIFLITSCALTVHGIIQISNYPLIQWWIAIFAITVDIYMQYALAWGRWLWKTKISANMGRAIGYFIGYAFYALTYNFFFAVGFFMTELDIKEQIIVQNSIVNNINRIKEIDEDLQIIREYQRTETKTGFGKKSEKLEADKKRLEKERENLLKSSENVSNVSVEVFKNVFNAWAKVLGDQTNKTANILKIVTFGVLVLTMQAGLIVTSWNLNLSSNVINNNILSEEKKELLRWLDAAFKGRCNGALNGVYSISEETKIPLERCIQIRDYLSKLKVNGGMAITTKQGVCKTNYDKNFIRDFILSH